MTVQIPSLTKKWRIYVKYDLDSGNGNSNTQSGQATSNPSLGIGNLASKVTYTTSKSKLKVQISFCQTQNHFYCFIWRFFTLLITQVCHTGKIFHCAVGDKVKNKKKCMTRSFQISYPKQKYKSYILFTKNSCFRKQKEGILNS